MRATKNKTPDWPVDMDQVIRKLNLRRLGPDGCVIVLAGALQDAGYPARAVQRRARGIQKAPGSGGEMETRLLMEQDQVAVRLGSLLLTPSLDTDWAGALRKAHKYLRVRSEQDLQWVTDFSSEEKLITEAQICQYENTPLPRSEACARELAAAMVRDILQGRARPGFPGAAPKDADSSFEALARRTLQGMRDGALGLLRLSSDEHTPMGILAVHLAKRLVDHGMEIEAFECREYTQEDGHTMERTEVFLKEPGQAPFFCGEPGVGELRCITEAVMGPQAALKPGTCSVLRRVPEWTNPVRPEYKIEEGLDTACAMLIQAHLHRGVAPVVAAKGVAQLRRM